MSTILIAVLFLFSSSSDFEKKHTVLAITNTAKVAIIKYVSKGIALNAQGNYSGDITYLDKSLDIDPNNKLA